MRLSNWSSTGWPPRGEARKKKGRLMNLMPVLLHKITESSNSTTETKGERTRITMCLRAGNVDGVEGMEGLEEIP